MPTEKKAKTIEQLKGVLSKATVGIITDYRGMTANEMNALRRKMRAAGVEFHVVKNTLARIAVDQLGTGAIGRGFDGTTAIAIGYGDIAQPAKTVLEYIRSTRETLLKIKAGFLGSRLLTVEEVSLLSTLPSREVLLARVLGGMQSPISNLVSHLAYPIRGFIGVLQARSKELEKAGDKEETKATA